MTGAPSEQTEKHWAHRAERHTERWRLLRDGDDYVLYSHRQYGDPWTWSKDGKHWFTGHPEWQRK